MENTMTQPIKRRGFGFYLRIYRKILVQDLKSKMSYRADFLISTIGMIMTLRTSLPLTAGITITCSSFTVFRWSR